MDASELPPIRRYDCFKDESPGWHTEEDAVEVYIMSWLEPGCDVEPAIRALFRDGVVMITVYDHKRLPLNEITVTADRALAVFRKRKPEWFRK